MQRPKHNFLYPITSLLILVLFAFVTLNHVYAKTYLLSPGQMTEVYAAFNKAGAGDTLYFAPGTYMIDKPLAPVNSGKADNWLVIMAAERKTAIIDGTDFLKDEEFGRSASRVGKGLLHIEGVSYVRVVNITVQNSHSLGIMVGTKNNPAWFTELIACNSHGSYNSGIGLWYSRHTKVFGCEITGANDQDLRTADVAVRREAPHEALTVAGAENFEVAYNYIHHCDKEGVDVKEVSNRGVVHHNLITDMPRQGLYADSWFGTLSDVTFHSNIVHDCEWGLAISAEGKDSYLKNLRIFNNILYNNVGSGFFISIWGHDMMRKDILIYNNTVYNNGTPDHWSGLTGGFGCVTRNVEELHIFNNVFADNFGYPVAFPFTGAIEDSLKDRDILIENNLMTSVAQKAPYPGFFDVMLYVYAGNNSIIADPGFQNADAGIFSLMDDAPAKGKAIQPYPFVEFQDLGAENQADKQILEVYFK